MDLIELRERLVEAAEQFLEERKLKPYIRIGHATTLNDKDQLCELHLNSRTTTYKKILADHFDNISRLSCQLVGGANEGFEKLEAFYPEGNKPLSFENQKQILLGNIQAALFPVGKTSDLQKFISLAQQAEQGQVAEPKKKRNPKWHRDEIILALDLYFKLEYRQIHAKTPEIIALSELLNKLPIHEVKPNQEKFRNPNGVGLKLSNFLAMDPDYEGEGMKSYSKLDEQTFHEFVDNKEELAAIAKHIKSAVLNEELIHKLYKVEEETDEEISVKEGSVIYKLHKLRERNPKINKKKKENYFKKHGQLDCEVCGFDFYEAYGELGNGYMECHHKLPLSELDEETTTRLDDLALVCANCHRMLHRKIDTLGVGQLKAIFKKHS